MRSEVRRSCALQMRGRSVHTRRGRVSSVHCRRRRPHRAAAAAALARTYLYVTLFLFSRRAPATPSPGGRVKY